MATKAKISAEIARMARTFSIRASGTIQTLGKNIRYAHTRANLPDVPQAASRQVQEVGKSGNYTTMPVLQNLPINNPATPALNTSVASSLEAVGPKTEITKATAPELHPATCNHILEASSTASISKVLKGASKHIRENRVTFILLTMGVTVTAGACLIIPILDATGFAPTGPAAGSRAAHWQSSLGSVPARSPFAWCQSAAMGGSPVGQIIAVGAAGAGIAAAAAASRLPGSRRRLLALFGIPVATIVVVYKSWETTRREITRYRR